MFHGSDIVSESLEPRQSINHGHLEIGAKVFATEFPEIAVFHALARTAKRTHSELRGTKHGFTVDKGIITLRAHPVLLARIRKLRALSNVYVVPKASFERINEMEWHSKTVARPLAVVFVSGRDFEVKGDSNVCLELL